jgi:hypothetical protein
MKNIHLLPTDKPSRLLKTIPKGNLILSKSITSGSHWENQHIYITSDEEIKEGDLKVGEYYLYFNKIRQFKEIDNLNRAWKDYKKIILTTDQDLIKDGVQAIDDTFLEWFVKNPSCEWVDVLTDAYTMQEIFELKLQNDDFKYKIIIPQEEPKQETLEEAALRLYPKFISDPYNPTEDLMEEERKIFIAGAKWQQEKMYSEEEVFEIAKQYAKRCQAPIQSSGWLKEQFKKK